MSVKLAWGHTRSHKLLRCAWRQHIAGESTSRDPALTHWYRIGDRERQAAKITAVLKGASLQPDDVESCFQALGVCFLAQGKAEDAARHAQEALQGEFGQLMSTLMFCYVCAYACMGVQ